MGEYAYISKDQSEALTHYGVLGMKWGQRKAKRQQRIDYRIAKNSVRKTNRSLREYKRAQKRAQNYKTTKNGMKAYDAQKKYEELANVSIAQAKKANSQVTYDWINDKYKISKKKR